MPELDDYLKHNEYENRLNMGAKEPPRGLPPRSINALNTRSMKNLDARGSSSTKNQGVNYNNKLSI